MLLYISEVNNPEVFHTYSIIPDGRLSNINLLLPSISLLIPEVILGNTDLHRTMHTSFFAILVPQSIYYMWPFLRSRSRPPFSIFSDPTQMDLIRLDSCLKFSFSTLSIIPSPIIDHPCSRKCRARKLSRRCYMITNKPQRSLSHS